MSLGLQHVSQGRMTWHAVSLFFAGSTVHVVYMEPEREEFD